MSGLAIARALGVSGSFVSALVNDPTGDGERERKRRYQGVCIDCGGPTQGGDGRGPKASRRCASCARKFQIDQRYWTRERVIDAIQRFARENGRPPYATDWSHAPGAGYPFASQVYRGSRSQKNSPFASWADAIEAAGFPRPLTGQYPRTDEWRLAVSRRTRIWTRPLIIAALQEWTKLHGRRPVYADWLTAGRGHPTTSTVTKWFGSWRAALKAADLL